MVSEAYQSLIRASGSNVKKNRAETDGTIPPVSASTKEDQYEKDTKDRFPFRRTCRADIREYRSS
jgi:hypothetical protein